MSRRLVQAGVLLLIGILILVGLLKAVNPGLVLAAMRDASPGWIALSVLCLTGFIGLRGIRWTIILRASRPGLGHADPTAITAVGFAVNSVAPFKIGDLLRLGSLAQRASIGVGEAGATVVLERILDVFGLLALAAAFAVSSGSAGRGGGLWGGVIIFALITGLIGLCGALVVAHEQQALLWWNRLLQRLPRAVRKRGQNLGASVILGLQCLRSPRRLVVITGLTLIIWLLAVFTNFAYFRAVTEQLPAATLLLALTLFAVSTAVSVTPGSVGTYEGFFLLVLGGFGAGPPATVAAAAVLSHVGGIVTLLACGFFGALWLRLRRAAPPVRLHRALAGEDGS